MAAYPLDDSPRSPNTGGHAGSRACLDNKEEENVLKLAGIEPRFFDLPNRNLNTIQTACLVLLQPRKFSTKLFVFFYVKKLKIHK